MNPGLQRADTDAQLDHLLNAALVTARDCGATPGERSQMLMELAMELQVRPRTPDHLRAAILLYDEALSICPDDEPLLAARITARKGTALQAAPDQGTELVEQALHAYDEAIPALKRLGCAEELAEAEMNRGLVLQYLAGHGRARLTDAIAAYQRAVQIFDRNRFPAEFAILQNNLATAFLSLPFTDDRASIREALAVQCFEEALKAVSIIEHPVEYAMLQNNLGNALQHGSTSHAAENRWRAISAYDEALKVRSPARMPMEFANTISNKSACLRALPDDPEHPELGNRANLERASRMYEEARQIFLAHDDVEKATLVAGEIDDIQRELMQAGR